MTRYPDRVLITGGTQEHRLLIATDLQALGINNTAGNDGGEAAVNLIREASGYSTDKFDLVIVLLQVADAGVAGLVTAIRRDFNGQELPIVLLASPKTSSEAKRIKEIGANASTTKHPSQMTLKWLIAQVFPGFGNRT